MEGEDASSGLVARRRRRISDEETEWRMLRTALDMINSTGLTVSLEHLSLEDIIRDAGVARSAVYRRWPYKDLFFSDLLRKLAEAPSAGGLPEDVASGQLIESVVAERPDWLETAQSRHDLLLEILRQATPGNFHFFHGSTQWRTYMALHATYFSLPAGSLRDDVQAALGRSEERVVADIASAYERWAGLLGYRLRPELGATFATMATLLDATMRGLVLTAPSVPDIVDRSIQAAPLGATEEREWSQPALALASLVVGFLEPDPDIVWNNERRSGVRQAVGASEKPRT